MRCIYLYGKPRPGSLYWDYAGRCEQDATTDDPYPLCADHAEAYGEKKGDKKVKWPTTK